MAIEVTHLEHIYMPDTPFEKKALDDVSFSIRDGEFVGLIGHTGSGKSTLVMHLNGLLKPSSGSIVVDGLNLSDKDVDLREIRKRVGLVFQYPEYQLFEESVVRDVMFGPLNLALPEEEARVRAAEALKMVGLPESVYDKSPFELSGGQKRRAAIAGVLAMKSNTLILDEPTAGLDPHGRDEILSIMRDIHAGGTTLIMVSHSMTDVSLLCSRILVMNHAHLTLDGTPETVFSDGDAIRAAGLEPPPCAQLAERLRADGWTNIPAGAYTKAALADAIAASLKAEKGAGVCR